MLQPKKKKKVKKICKSIPLQNQETRRIKKKTSGTEYKN